jgi:hypothetical protein
MLNSKQQTHEKVRVLLRVSKNCVVRTCPEASNLHVVSAVYICKWNSVYSSNANWLPGLKNGSFGANTASADSKSKGF